jgi:hypothetical protein
MVTYVSTIKIQYVGGFTKKKTSLNLNIIFNPTGKYLNKNVLNLCISRRVRAKRSLSTPQEEQSKETRMFKRLQ